MPYNNNTPLSNRQIHFCSLCAVANLNPSDSNDLVFTFNAGINIPSNVNMLVSLKSLELPKAWYNVNTHNQILPASTITAPLTLPEGNYNEYTLTTALNTLFGGSILVSYSELTDKYTFVNSLAAVWSWTFPEEEGKLNLRASGIARLLGFRTGTYTSNALGILIAPFSADLNYTTCVYVRTNFATNQYDSRTENVRSLLAKVPLQIHRQPWAYQNMGGAAADDYQGSGFGQSGHMVYYQGYNSSDQILVDENYQINNIRITLEDDHLNLIPLQDTVWSATILIEYVYKEIYEPGRGLITEVTPQAVMDEDIAKQHQETETQDIKQKNLEYIKKNR